MRDSDASWRKVLHPDTLRSNLVAASLFIAAYEIFKDQIVDRPKSFFLNGFAENGLIIDERYKTAVLAKSSHGVLQASLLWFREMDAIDDSDLTRFAGIREYRNKVVHHLPAYLTDAKINLDQTMFDELVQLLLKIEKWWFIHIEAAVNPDLLPEGANADDVLPGSVMSIQLMMDVAAGKEPEAGYYYGAYNNVANERK